MSYEIIEELDKKGINLQETILNLENQGYKWYWDLYLRQILNRAMMELTWKMSKELLEKLK